jgi:1-acyl-sn-glycerol-3-phosphate acyltransferase
MPEKSLLLSVSNVYETLAISVPTVVDAALGRVQKEVCDERLAGWSARLVENAAMTLDVRGRENLAPGRAYLVMSNHQSHYDIPVLFCVLGANVRMVAKTELFKFPIFGHAMREAGFIEIDRSNRHRAVESLAVAKEQLARGTNVWIAPEGTRSRTGELLPFKKGGFVVAMDTGWPILPVTIQGTRDALPADGRRSRKGAHVVVTLHPVVDTAAYLAGPGNAKEQRERLMADVRAAIASAL